MSALATAAHRLAESGCFVFPCRARDKRPAQDGWPQAATRDPAVIRQWWTARPDFNIGLATGPSGLLVVDLDGPAGLANWRELLAEHPGTPPTLTARTGGGGWHLYFLAPADRQLGNSAGKIAEKIDSRGRGGFVVSPPSLHPNGQQYVWAERQPAAMPELPGWIADLLDPAPPVRLATRPAQAIGNGYAAGALRSAVERVAGAPQGTRNAVLNSESYSLARLLADGSLDPRNAVAELLGAATAAGLPSREAVGTITSALRARVGAVA